MPIAFHPKTGMVLVCDFSGFKPPEMVKVRPVIVVSPNHLLRAGLVTVVPLSTTPPVPVMAYHYRLKGAPVPGKAHSDVWAKCDMICTIGSHRLDRVKLERGRYVVGHVSMDQVKAIRLAAAASFGVIVETD